MADERMKAVAPDLDEEVEESEEAEEEEVEEEEENEDSERSIWMSYSHVERSPRRLDMRRDWEQDLEEDEFMRMFHHKRARVFDLGQSSQYTGTSSNYHHFSPENELNNMLYSPEETVDAVSSITNFQPIGNIALTGVFLPTGEDMDENLSKMDLSDDLLHLIFTFLEQKDICRAGATCKQWHIASSHEDFWRSLEFENFSISQQNFVSICQRYHQNVKELNLSGVPNADMLFTEASIYLTRLETLIMGKGTLSDACFQVISEMRSLTNLSIYDAYLGSMIQESTIQNDKLKDLQIIRCRAHRISIRCPEVERLSLKRSSMMNVTLQSPKVRRLDLSSCHKLSDTAIRAAAVTCPQLVSLDMSFCACVTDETLREVSQFCPALSVLDASYCPNISFDSVRLEKLLDLKLQSCEGITSASMIHISQSPLLEALQLDNCGLLTSVTLDLPHLKKISLVHLRKFVDLNLRCPVLQYIKVSRCSALHRISITSNSLQKLVLQKQESLTTLTLQCNNLLDVDLSDCESVTNSICNVFSDGGGCPLLRSLILDNCESLSMVDIRSCTMAYLSLAGCRSMTSLKLSCPNLQKVNLDCCDHLEIATFSPVGLETLNLGICPKLSSVHIEAPKMIALELKGCGVLSTAIIKCPCLKSLDASFCRQFVDESLTSMASLCPNIEQLILSSCLAIGEKGLYSLNRLSSVTLLDLSYTFLINLQPVFDACSQLKVLKLSACKFLTDSSLDALYKQGALPSLLELDLSYSSIGQTAITELLSSCTNLVHVNLNGCTNLNELVCSSYLEEESDDMDVDEEEMDGDKMEEGDEVVRSERLLEVLNCTGCPNVRKVVIPSGANCVHLTKVNLNLSANLKEVDVSCSNLSTLILSHCTSLETLKLDCPKLMNLQLLACTMLEEHELEAAISQCTMLESLNILHCSKMTLENFGRLRTVCPSLKRVQSDYLVGSNEGSKL